MEQDELLWRLYEDNRNFARFHESQRSTATGLIAGGNAALVAAMLSTNGLGAEDLPFSIMVVIIGLIGLVIAMKSTEKLRRHNSRAAAFLNLIIEADFDVDVNNLKFEVDRKIDQRHWFTSKFRQSSLWVGINFVVLASGIFVLGKVIGCW